MTKNTYLLFIASVIVFPSCKIYDFYQTNSKQLPTFANMLNLAQSMQKVAVKNGEITSEEANAIMGKSTRIDEWGNRLIFVAIREPKFSFILVSPGRDGRLDTDDIYDYFSLGKENIVGKYDRDIIFRDGEVVTIASAK